MTRNTYSLLLYLLSPLLVIYLLFRAIKSADYRSRWGERFGFCRLKKTDILIHCVSMGETLAALPLINLIQQKYPSLTITVTTTSPTGSKEVTKALKDKVQHVYLPFDIPFCVKRFISQIKPETLIIMETELWPNLLHYAKAQQCNVMLTNARLSKKSAEKYQKWEALARPMLAMIDCIAVQTKVEANRFIDLGVNPDNLTVCGNIKFDLKLHENQIQQANTERQLWNKSNSLVWIAGSVHPDEFDIVLTTHQQLLSQFPDALMIMVPRHPEQFNAAADAIKRFEFSFSRRSTSDDVTQTTQVLLADTMGELLHLYACGDAAFVGGTLIENGGHNPLEPAALGLPVFEGPHHWDFAEITQLLNDAGALFLIKNATELTNGIIKIVTNSELKQQTSQAGLNVVNANKGALAKQFSLVETLLH